MKIENKILRRLVYFVPLVLLVVLTFSTLGCHPAALVVPSYVQNVGVDVVQNQTSYFGFDTALTQKLILKFQEDGRLPVEDPGRSDLVVKVILRKYLEEPILYDTKTNAVLQYRVSVTYDLAAVDEREKRTFLEDTDKVHSIYYYTPQYLGAVIETKDQALDRLMDDLSRSVVRRVLEGY